MEVFLTVTHLKVELEFELKEIVWPDNKQYNSF